MFCPGHQPGGAAACAGAGAAVSVLLIVWVPTEIVIKDSLWVVRREQMAHLGEGHGSGSLSRAANRSKSRSKLTRRQPLAIARAARWASVQRRDGISPRSRW